MNPLGHACVPVENGSTIHISVSLSYPETATVADKPSKGLFVRIADVRAITWLTESQLQLGSFLLDSIITLTFITLSGMIVLGPCEKSELTRR